MAQFRMILTPCVALVLAMVFLLAGCAPPKYTDYDAFIKSPRPIVGGTPYVIEPPDSIRIIAPNAPEIDGITQRLRPDGYITLYLLGDIFSAGKTPTQLASEIEERILKYYQDVTVQIQVTGFNSKRYYVAGETASGPRNYNGTDTVLDAALRSGIPRTSWPEHALLIRPNEQGDLIRRMTVDLTRMIETGDLKHNVVLEEGDILFIPVNPLAAIGYTFQNLLFPVSPAISAVSAPYRIADAPADARGDN